MPEAPGVKYPRRILEPPAGRMAPIDPFKLEDLAAPEEAAEPDEVAEVELVH